MTSAARATERYQKKKGLISKSYKLPREIVDEFAETCEAMDLSQAKFNFRQKQSKKLTKHMKHAIITVW